MLQRGEEGTNEWLKYCGLTVTIIRPKITTKYSIFWQKSLCVALGHDFKLFTYTNHGVKETGMQCYGQINLCGWLELVYYLKISRYIWVR